MPIKPELRWFYPIDRKQVSHWVRFVRAKGRCQVCGRLHDETVPQPADARCREGRGSRVPSPPRSTPVVSPAPQSARVLAANAASSTGSVTTPRRIDQDLSTGDSLPLPARLKESFIGKIRPQLHVGWRASRPQVYVGPAPNYTWISVLQALEVGEAPPTTRSLNS
jgi:hypothetical protein